MPETPTPASTVVVNDNGLCRLRTLTYVSLGLNALILASLLVCAIIHHHHKHHGFGGGDGGRFEGQCQMGRHFHHFGGMDRGWGRPDGGRFGERDGNGMKFRDREDGGKGFGDRDGGPRGFGGGPGMPGRHGMMGEGKNGPPDPAKMTDGILNHLTTTLTLTDDEKAKIKPIIADQVAQMQKEMEAQRAATQKQIEAGKAKIRPLLTPDQQKQFDAMPLPGQKPPTPDAAKPGP